MPEKKFITFLHIPMGSSYSSMKAYNIFAHIRNIYKRDFITFLHTIEAYSMPLPKELFKPFLYNLYRIPFFSR
jgi:hypothetical protein